MKMKKTDYIRILSLLLAASVLMGGCSSRSAQQSEQTSQPVQQETQVEEEPSETSEQDQQQEREQEPQETSEEDQQQNDSAQEEAPPQDEAQSGEEADNPSEQAPENTEETEENAEQTEDAASNGSTYTAEQYMQYDQFVEPLRTSQILQQDFSPEQPPAFGNHVWYGLTVYGFDPTLSAYAGQDGNGHFAAETIEGLIMEHFDVTPRADSGGQRCLLGGVWAPISSRRVWGDTRRTLASAVRTGKGTRWCWWLTSTPTRTKSSTPRC